MDETLDLEWFLGAFYSAEELRDVCRRVNNALDERIFVISRPKFELLEDVLAALQDGNPDDEVYSTIVGYLETVIPVEDLNDAVDDLDLRSSLPSRARKHQKFDLVFEAVARGDVIDEVAPEESQKTTRERPPSARSAQESTSNTTSAGLVLYDRYRILRAIRAGGMAQAYCVERTSDEKHLFLKRVQCPSGSSEYYDSLKREIDVYTKIDRADLGRFVLPCVDICRDDASLALILEWAPGGSLADAMEKGSAPPPGVFAANVLRALEGLHNADVIHRDLKPDNILLAADGSWKLSDFGISKNMARLVTQGRTFQGYGTPGFEAPEQKVLGVSATAPMDIYAFGKTLASLTTNGRTDVDRMPEGPWKALASWCTTRDPDLRPSATVALQFVNAQ